MTLPLPRELLTVDGCCRGNSHFLQWYSHWSVVHIPMDSSTPMPTWEYLVKLNESCNKTKAKQKDMIMGEFIEEKGIDGGGCAIKEE